MMLDGANERYTPASVVARCAELAGVKAFDLDAAASELSHHAPRWFSLADDGLARDWFGDVWLNPPFSRIAEWMAKAAREVAAGRARSVSALLPANRTEQPWWHQHIEPRMRTPVEGVVATVHHLAGRVRFLRPDGTRMGSPQFGVCLIVFTRHLETISRLTPKRGRPRAVSPELETEGWRLLREEGLTVDAMVERLGVAKESWYRATRPPAERAARRRRDRRALPSSKVRAITRLRSQGLTLAAIAERLGVHLNTVHKHLRRAQATRRRGAQPPPA